MYMIDLGLDAYVNATSIVAVMRFDPEDMETIIANPVQDMSLVRWLVKVVDASGWFASNLSDREIRNRLRKVGYEIV